MKFIKKYPNRVFRPSLSQEIFLKDCGSIFLENDEQVTFMSNGKSEYDVLKKIWGYYATPSLNKRLPSFGIVPALVFGENSSAYIMLVERGYEESFFSYLASEKMNLIGWLDDDNFLMDIKKIARPN